MLYTKSYQLFCRKKISMLAGLKISSLEYKSVFYRLEHNAKEGMKFNFESLEIKDWHLPADRVQRLDKDWALGYNFTKFLKILLIFPNFYSLSSIQWYISFLHFKKFKIQFHEIPYLHYILICKKTILNISPKLWLMFCCHH